MPAKGRGGRLNSATSVSKTPVRTESDEERENKEESDASDTEDVSKDIQGFSPCGKTKKQKYICSGGDKVCGQRIIRGEASVMCDVCKEWFHAKCQGLSMEAFKALSLHCAEFIWLCKGCKPNLIQLFR